MPWYKAELTRYSFLCHILLIWTRVRGIIDWNFCFMYFIENAMRQAYQYTSCIVFSWTDLQVCADYTTMGCSCTAAPINVVVLHVCKPLHQNNSLFLSERILWCTCTWDLQLLHVSHKSLHSIPEYAWLITSGQGNVLWLALNDLQTGQLRGQ